jgi:hypothetical protein
MSCEQPVGGWHPELPVDQVWGALGSWVGHGGADPLVAAYALSAVGAHEPLDGGLGHRNALTLQVRPHLHRPVQRLRRPVAVLVRLVVAGQTSVIVASHSDRFEGARATHAWKVLGAIGTPCSVSTRQIGATSIHSLWSAMNWPLCASGGATGSGTDAHRRSPVLRAVNERSRCQGAV